MKKPPIVIEIILDTCLNSQEPASACLAFADYLKKSHRNVAARIVYTRELYREQTGLLSPELVPLRTQDQNYAHHAQLSTQLHQHPEHVVILGEDIFSRKFSQSMLAMAQQVARERPNATCVQRALTELGCNQKNFLNFTHLSPDQAQIVYDNFVKNVRIKKEYKGMKTAENFREIRHNNADDSVLGYLELGDAQTDQTHQQKKLIVVASTDGGLCKKAAGIRPYNKRIRIAVVGEYELYKLLNETMRTLDRQTPHDTKIPDMMFKRPSHQIAGLVEYIAPARSSVTARR